MTAKDNLGAIFDVLANNSADVETVIRQFGGIQNLLHAAPALFRIAKTISAQRDAVAAAERASLALAYNEETRDKVADFQRKHHLLADGIVGQNTWATVERLLSQIEDD